MTERIPTGITLPQKSRVLEIAFADGRTFRLPYEFLELVSRRIINEVNGISRVTYDISSKPPATIEWE